MSDGAPLPAPSAMAAALLREIADRLAALLETGETSAIDLRSLPMSPDERAALLETLGEGEVRATVEAAGRSEIVETRYPGVWRVDHFAPDGAPRHAEILISPVPELLRADPADIEDGAERLIAALDSYGPADPEGDDA